MAAAQWPRGHRLFAPRDGQQDPMLIAETVRQVGVLLAHVRFDVPLGHHFLMWDLAYAAVPGTLAEHEEPTDLTLRVGCQDVTRRGSRLSGLRYHAELWRDRTRLATASARFNCTSPEVYARLRGARPAGPQVPPGPPVEPALVGRVDSRDVVLAPAPEPGHWRLRVDPGHPVFFDHPQDHVPGMLLLEAARQAAQALLSPLPVQPIALSGTFGRYAEHTVPTWIEAEAGRPDPDGSTPVTVVGHQNGEPLFTADVLARPTT